MKKNLLIITLALLASQASFAMDNNNNNNNNKRSASENNGNSNAKKYNRFYEQEGDIPFFATLAMQNEAHANNLHTNAPYHELPTGPRMTLPFQNNNNNNQLFADDDAVDIIDHNNNNNLRCIHPGCTHVAAAQGALEIHKRTHTGEKPHKCNQPGCTYQSTQKGNLEIHKRTHTGEKPFPCDRPGCTYAAAAQSNLARHKRTHTGEKPFQNNNNNNNLPSNHEDDESDDDHSNPEHIDKKVRSSGNHKCPHPDCVNRDPYKRSNALQAHLLTHKENPEEQRPFPCRIDGCNERFRQIGHRNAHEQSLKHANEKRHRCQHQDCNASFARKSDLTNHINTAHLNIANPSLTCTICGKTLCRESNLTAHMRVHNGEKPYQCECGKGFARSDALSGHQRICPSSNPSAAAILARMNGYQNPEAINRCDNNNNNNNHDNSDHDDDNDDNDLE